MIYEDEIKYTLNKEKSDTPIYKVLSDSINDDYSLFDMIQFTHTFDNTGLYCCSGQSVNVTINLNDVFMYMSENELLLFNNKGDNFYSYDDYNPDPNFTNLEFLANCNRLLISPKLIDEIKDKKEITTTLSLFDVESKTNDLPSFITNYKDIRGKTFFQTNINNTGVYNIFTKESGIFESYFKNCRIIYQLVNLPYEYYSKHIVQPSTFHYNYTTNEFVSCFKNTDGIIKTIKSINDSGLMVPLFLKINKYGTITSLINCNTRFIASLYLKLPYVPCVLVYDGITDITNTIENYPYVNDFCFNYFKTNLSNFYNKIS